MRRTTFCAEMPAVDERSHDGLDNRVHNLHHDRDHTFLERNGAVDVPALETAAPAWVFPKPAVGDHDQRHRVGYSRLFDIAQSRYVA
jgi:hypothetical protein